MGNCFSQSASCQRPLLIMIGLDAVVKLLYYTNQDQEQWKAQLQQQDIIQNKYQGYWRSRQLRNLWKHYMKNSKGIIYIIDCSDKERMDETKSELYRMLLNPLMLGQPHLIYSNKQDLVKMKSEELEVELNINKICKNWHIQPSSSITGEGLQEGLNWIQEQLQLQLK
uniref:Rab_C60 protein n=1 Tax=Paramecium tetraurelia TaxID=5888 RepID=Q3SDQ9_PARTE|nr:rab_C60 [Paramecium tetraurelia]